MTTKRWPATYAFLCIVVVVVVVLETYAPQM